MAPTVPAIVEGHHLCDRHLQRDARIYVAGHAGLVGSAIVRRLRAEGFDPILTATRSRARPAGPGGGGGMVRATPARVRHPRGGDGGRHPGQRHPPGRIPLRQPHDPLHGRARQPQRRRAAAALPGQLLHLPEGRRPAHHPRTALLTGPLEADQRAVRHCQDRRDPVVRGLPDPVRVRLHHRHAHQRLRPATTTSTSRGHVLAGPDAAVRRRPVAGNDEVVVWGTGTARREFLHVDDLADCCLFLLRHYEGPGHINVGTGHDVSIARLAELLAAVVHPAATVVFDPSKPDGTPASCST